MITRDDMMARRDEWMARKDEIQGRFVERIDDPQVDAAIGLSLVGSGMGTGIMNLIRGKRSVWAYLLPGAFVLAGLAVISGGALSRRSGRIVTAEEVVRAQLAALDPIARAQVLRSAASETLAPFVHRNTN